MRVQTQNDPPFVEVAANPAPTLPPLAMQALLAANVQPVIGCFVGFDLLDRALVVGVADCPGERLVARSTVALRHADIGREAVLMFERGDPRRPLVMGLLHSGNEPGGPEPVPALPAVLADGECQLITAERELVLRCGDASITLTRAGKVVIEGRYVLSRSSGCNKIKGAAIDIN